MAWNKSLNCFNIAEIAQNILIGRYVILIHMDFFSTIETGQLIKEEHWKLKHINKNTIKSPNSFNHKLALNNYLLKNNQVSNLDLRTWYTDDSIPGQLFKLLTIGFFVSTIASIVINGLSRHSNKYDKCLRKQIWTHFKLSPQNYLVK